MYTSGGDRYFYKKKKSDVIWWKKETAGGHKFSFDKETVYDLMTDYPEKLNAEQKKIFDDKYVATRDFEFSANYAMKKLFFEYYIKWPKNMMKEVLKKIIPYGVKRVIKRMVGD